jgi:isoquinoline 1-oxidoreductase subunit beta
LDLKIENGQVLVEKVVPGSGLWIGHQSRCGQKPLRGLRGGWHRHGNVWRVEVCQRCTRIESNLDRYRMIRMSEAPKVIETHFVESQVDPTGLGEPGYPPVFAALANALYGRLESGFMISPLSISFRRDDIG